MQVHTPLFGPSFWHLSYKIPNISKAFLLRKFLKIKVNSDFCQEWDGFLNFFCYWREGNKCTGKLYKWAAWEQCLYFSFQSIISYLSLGKLFPKSFICRTSIPWTMLNFTGISNLRYVYNNKGQRRVLCCPHHWAGPVPWCLPKYLLPDMGKNNKKTVKKSPQTKQNKRYPTKSKPTSTPVSCIRFLGFKMGWGPTLSSVRDPHSSSPHFPINQRSSDHSASDQQNQRAAAKRYFLCLRLFGPAPCPTQSLVPCPEGKPQM